MLPTTNYGLPAVLDESVLEAILSSMADVSISMTSISLYVVGSGGYMANLEEEYRRLNLLDKVVYHSVGSKSRNSFKTEFQRDFLSIRHYRVW